MGSWRAMRRPKPGPAARVALSGSGADVGRRAAPAAPPLALVRSGDAITIDAQRREITLHVGAAELKRRRKSWTRPKAYARRGALAKYARQVSSASLGAVTDLPQGALRSPKIS